jgi:hypothetical protein
MVDMPYPNTTQSAKRSANQTAYLDVSKISDHTASAPPARRRMDPRALRAVSPWLVGAGRGSAGGGDWWAVGGSLLRGCRTAQGQRRHQGQYRGRRACCTRRASLGYMEFAASSGTCIQDGYNVRRSLLDGAVS